MASRTLNAAGQRPPVPLEPLDVANELACIRARVRLLEVALLGGGGGMSLEEGTYHDALIQGAQDVANGLDALAERIKA